MTPIFVFIALPTFSVALLMAVLYRRLTTASVQTRPSEHVMRRAMSRLEALQLLGLDDAADTKSIHAAYRRLMIQYHPDHGGSHNTAARLNLARDTLLRVRKNRAA